MTNFYWVIGFTRKEHDKSTTIMEDIWDDPDRHNPIYKTIFFKKKDAQAICDKMNKERNKFLPRTSRYIPVKIKPIEQY